jgi:ribA/ribD-fused uncharacterized protein
MIDKFSGAYRFLSNFYPAEVHLDGVAWPSVEHAYQAAKIWEGSFSSLSVAKAREVYIRGKTAGGAKKMGSELNLKGKRRPEWEKVSLKIMEDLVREKFTTDPMIRLQLMATSQEELVEGNTWNDTFWGVCDGVGENHLGRILMKVRAELRAQMPGSDSQ